MRRFAIIPAGSWPRRMPAAIAAGYCGEPTVEAFLKRVGIEYPQPRVKEREAPAVVERRSGPSYCPGHRAGRPRRGFVTLERALPRFVEVRRLARGSAAFYFRIPT